MERLLLIEGISATTNLKFIPKNSTFDGNKPSEINMMKLHKLCLLGSAHQEESNNVCESINVNVKTITGKSIYISINQDASIESMKRMVEKKENIQIDQQRYIFGGRQLQDEKNLSDYNIYNGCTVLLVINNDNESNNQIFYIDNHLSPRYDYDFRYITDIDYSQVTFNGSGNSNGNNSTISGVPIKYMRGGEVYVRPCGWMRFALNVDKYLEPGSNSAWLGSSNGAGEWVVSYHGTSECDFGTMAIVGYNLATINQIKFKRAVYTTPSVKCAEKYATPFTYQGEKYIVIFQNRINPNTLIKIPKQDNDDEYWITTNYQDIRPYGICIKKVIQDSN